jgi:hypothetical protein
MKKILIFLVLGMFTLNTTNAWLWLIAENGDLLNIAKWNELINKLENRLNTWSLVAWDYTGLTYSWNTIKINSIWRWGSETPFIDSKQLYWYKDEKFTITLKWTNFLPNSKVTIPWFDWTIDNVSVTSESSMNITLTPWDEETFYDIVISNNGVLNTEWSWNGTNILKLRDSFTITWNDSEGRRYTNYRYAKTCNDYKNPIAPYKYDGSIWNWIYIIKPNSDPSFKVYCDMDTDNWGWTRFVDIKWNYGFENAKRCWLWNIINNSNLDCFNPSRYWINPSKLMNIDWSWKYNYTLINWSSSVSTYTRLDVRRCLWHSEYMTVMSNTEDPKSDLSNLSHIWLWQNFCKSGRETAWSTSTRFMNYDPHWDFWGVTSADRENNARNTKLYFR